MNNTGSASFNVPAEEECMKKCPKCGYEKVAAAVVEAAPTLPPTTPVPESAPEKKGFFSFLGLGGRRARTGRKHRRSMKGTRKSTRKGTRKNGRKTGARKH